MIAKVTRGGDLHGLMRYLIGPGRANEHTSPHMVAGSDGVMHWWSDSELSVGSGDARAIGDYLNLPRELTGTRIQSRVSVFDTETRQVKKYAELRDAHVWHCSLSLAPGHAPVEDHTWAAIAHDFVDAMGFSDAGGRANTRWVAVHHGASKNGGDHIHLAVNLVREDGTKADTWQDFIRASRAVADLEKKYGLEVVEGREVGRSAPVVSQQDQREHETTPGSVEPYTKTLARKVRACAVASENEAEFVRRLRREGLWVRPRFAADTQDVTVGYSVAARPENGEQPQWRKGSGLGRDLSLPRLRATWVDDPGAALAAAEEWRAAWRGKRILGGSERELSTPTTETWTHYTEEMRALRASLADVDPADHATWARLAHEASGTLAAWSLRLEARPGPLATASDQLARAASLHTRHVRPPAVRGLSMRGPAHLLMMGAVGPDTRTAQAILLRELVATLVELHRAFEQTRQLRYAEDLARALDVDLRHVHDGLLADKPAAGAAETPARNAGEPTRPRPQSPIPGQVADQRINTTQERRGPDLER